LSGYFTTIASAIFLGKSFEPTREPALPAEEDDDEVVLEDEDPEDVEDEEPRPEGFEVDELSFPTDETPVEPVPIESIEEIIIERPGIRHVAAWCGSAALRNPERDIQFAVDTNIDRLHLVINDHSKWRSPQPWTMRDEGKVRGFIQRAQDAGISVSLMSWVMPHKDYINKAADTLMPLCTELGVDLEWDAEEPWTKATKGMGYEEAASLIAERFKGRSFTMASNAIIYTPKKKYGPLARVSDLLIPQCYSTSTSGVKPEDAVALGVRRWKKYGFGTRFAIGLAAYRQSGIKGHTIQSAMRTTITSAQTLEGVSTVVYWSLRQIRSSRTATATIRSIEKVS
jgi:hypothetical protein